MRTAWTPSSPHVLLLIPAVQHAAPTGFSRSLGVNRVLKADPCPIPRFRCRRLGGGGRGQRESERWPLSRAPAGGERLMTRWRYAASAWISALASLPRPINLVWRLLDHLDTCVTLWVNAEQGKFELSSRHFKALVRVWAIDGEGSASLPRLLSKSSPLGYLHPLPFSPRTQSLLF